MVEALLAPTGRTASPPPPSGYLVQDLFWPLSRRDDRLEHVRARVGPAVIAVVLLVGSSDGPSAVRQSRALCEYVSRTAPVLAGWSVTRCDLADPLS